MRSNEIKPPSSFYFLESEMVDPARLKAERAKAQKLKKTQWWLDQLNRGFCHYCEKKIARKDLTMDHVVPLARGGTSTKGNIVPSCKPCNQNKKLKTPAEELLDSIK